MPNDLELIPGMFTTRGEVAAAFGGAKYGGIEQAVESKMVFVYSDPKAGEKHGYTFDGRTENDDRGTLFLYTGEGPTGDQTLTSGNDALLHHVRDDRTVHLFVADGHTTNPVTGKKKKEKRQRYVGQMIVDLEQPFERRRAPDEDDVMRWVYVFHLRPDPAASHAPKFDPKDAVAPAPITDTVEIDLDDEEQDAVTADLPGHIVVDWASQDAIQVETEEHATDETIAEITGGPRLVQRREGRLVKAYKAYLQAAGHVVKAHQITVEGVRGILRTDLYDASDNVLYEAKSSIRRADVRMAIGQLRDYRRHINAPDGLRLAVLLPGDPGEDLRNLLAEEDIALVMRTADAFDGFPVA